MPTMTDTPRVWIGSLAAYNDGRLIGQWTDADDLDTLETVTAEVLKAGGGEEIALMDREGFGDLIGEYTPLVKVAEIAAAIDEHGAPFVAYAENVIGGEIDDVAEMIADFENAYSGEYGTLADYAEDMVEQGLFGEIPENLTNYIDTDAIARDLECDGYSCVDGYVFTPI